MPFTAQDIRDLGYEVPDGNGPAIPVDQPIGGGQARPGRGHLPRQPGRMNKTEAAYADHLQLRVETGLIAAWSFEPMKLRLADRTFYEPDFLVQQTDGTLEIHETKGHWEDDARVKIKVAARLHPWFIFKAIRQIPEKDGGGWEVETFNA